MKTDALDQVQRNILSQLDKSENLYLVVFYS